MTTELAKVDELTAEQRDLVLRTVAKGATADELALYLHDCQRRGVHPLDRLLHFTIRTDAKGGRRYTPITSIDLFRSRAASTGALAGMDDATYVTEPGTHYPQSATITVYRIVQGVRCPTTKTARWFEYKPEKDDFMWRRMPFTMLSKCAEALALRAAFPAELGGLYTNDEMDQAGPQDANMTYQANALTPAEQVQAQRDHPQPAPEPHVSTQDIDRLRAIGMDLGLTEGERAVCLMDIPIKRISALRLKDVDKLILAMHRMAVEKLLKRLQLNLDDVRLEAPSVVADEPQDLDLEQAQTALGILRAAWERNAVPS